MNALRKSTSPTVQHLVTTKAAADQHHCKEDLSPCHSHILGDAVRNSEPQVLVAEQVEPVPHGASSNRDPAVDGMILLKENF